MRKLKNSVKIYILATISLFFATLNCSNTTEETSLKAQIGQMLMVGFRGMDLSPDNHIVSDITQLHVGGVILFDYDMPSKKYGRNIKSPQQLKKLNADLQNLTDTKLLIAIDQEGGRVNRLRTVYGFPPTVSAKFQGKINVVDTTVKYAAQTAATLAQLGFNLNFAPCVDVDVNPQCPIIGKLERSFSANPEVVTKHAEIWLTEQALQGVVGCIKHFPGHGSAKTDTHIGAADVTDTWTDAELAPYRNLIRTGKVQAIMTAHVFNAKLDARYPATMSEAVITGLLRRQLGFDGVVVTDDLAMGALVAHYSLEEILVRAVLAGADVLCLSNNGATYDPHIAQKAVDIIFKAVQDGRIPRPCIEASYARIMKLKRNLSL
jgi:beta-N-acetylhexosaminidase